MPVKEDYDSKQEFSTGMADYYLNITHDCEEQPGQCHGHPIGLGGVPPIGVR